MESRPAAHAKPKEEEEVTPVSSLYEWVEAAIFSLICVTLVFTFLFRIVGVDGESMQTTLMDRDRLILSELAYTPARGDIVVINRYVEEPLIKRVIGLPGDTIYIDGDTQAVYRNGEKLDEPYVHGSPTPPRELQGEVTVPEGHLFVMGDNRVYSKDSRYTDVGTHGFIDIKDVMGKAVFRLWPFNTFGSIA